MLCHVYVLKSQKNAQNHDVEYHRSSNWARDMPQLCEWPTQITAKWSAISTAEFLCDGCGRVFGSSRGELLTWLGARPSRTHVGNRSLPSFNKLQQQLSSNHVLHKRRPHPFTTICCIEFFHSSFRPVCDVFVYVFKKQTKKFQSC